MRAVLRRVSAPMAASNSLAGMMDPGSRVESLIQRLRLYKAPSSSFSSDSEGECDDDVDERGKVFSRMGMAESAATGKVIVPRPEGCKSRPRAAVLICLFEGDLGELRVILTKRSSTLSTHSGKTAASPRSLISRQNLFAGRRKAPYSAVGCAMRPALRSISLPAGEVSLPGGKAEDGDVDDAHTATREAKEEIGLDPSLVTVVTLLEPFLSKV